MKKQTIELSQYTAAYHSQGEGLPVILLHGFFGDCWTLQLIAQELATSYRCISLDLLGFGDSSKPQMRYRIEDQVKFLQEFIAAQNLSKFYLIGYSYGAWTAAAYAIALAGQVQSQSVLANLVLLAPAGIRDDDFVGRHNYLKPLLWQTPLVEVALGAIAPVAKLVGKERFFNSIREARQAIMSQPVAKSLLLDRLNPEDAVDTVEGEIDRITIPTLVIAGENDKLIPLWHSQTYVDRIPQANIAIIVGAEHDLVSSHYQEVVQAITQSWHHTQE
jgi:pimeloyl-ACP methyl ester carboxylesterase